MADTRWLDDEEQRAWRAFVRMQSQLAAHLNRQLQTCSGLSLADYEVLVQLTDTPEERLRPYEIQRSLQWEQSRLSHQLTRMRRRDLITREDCPGDRRGAYVVLTDAGRRAIEAAAPGHVDTVRSLIFDQLTRDEVAALGRLSTRILDRLDPPSRAEPARRVAADQGAERSEMRAAGPGTTRSIVDLYASSLVRDTG